MTPARIRRLVEERIGLDPDSLGATAFDTAVRTAGQTYASLDEYARVLETDRKVFDDLIERLSVPETWFFRGGRLFQVLARLVAMRTDAKKAVRIMCLPCSSGEEPYSLAIALTEAGLPHSCWEIEGVDLRPAAIAAAKRGIYRDFSFRETPPEVRGKYFREINGSWELSDSIRQRVKFQTGNVLDYSSGMFDIILCRNLLIYLSPAGRRRAIDRLLDMLVPEGFLGFGHAEPSALADRGLTQVDSTELFLFTRSAAPAKQTHVQLPSMEYLAPVPQLPVREIPTTREVPRPSLEHARLLADTGQLAEALAECQRSILVTPSAEAFALLGLIQQALGDHRGAHDAFRKSLYLDPGNATAKAMSRIAGGAA